MKFAFLWLPLSSALIFFFNSESTNAAVVQISTQQAQGLSSGQVTNLEIPDRDGLNINFIPSGDIIEKVWIDSPTAFSLDVDGCLTHLNSGNSGVNQGAN